MDVTKFVSIILNASLSDLKSTLRSSTLFTRNFSVSSCIFLGALKFFNFLTILSLTWIGVSNSYILNHSSSRHYYAVTLFLGAGDGPGIAAYPWLNVIWFLTKVFILIGVMIWLRGTLPRLRVDQLMSFAWKFLMPLSILNIFVAGFAWHAQNTNNPNEETSLTIRIVIWISALIILYTAAKGLDQVNRSKIKPRTYKYGE